MSVLRVADALIGLEEVEGSDAEEDDEEEEERVAAAAGGELPCPFCGEEFDAVGLYFHIDGEHHAEAKAGVIIIITIFYFPLFL